MTNPSTKIGFIGLGRMGKGIAVNLAKARFDLMVYSSNESKLVEFEKICKVTNDYEEIFAHSKVLFLCLPGSPEVEEVVHQYIEFGVKDKTIIDLSTSYPLSSIQLFNEIKSHGGHFFDASLTGGPQNAAEGTINVIVGGEEDGFLEVKPIIKSIASKFFFIGTPGAGNVVKLANNYLSIMYVALYAEIIPLLKKMDVDLDIFCEIVSNSGANSKMFQLTAPKMIHHEFDFSFGMNLAIKDLTYIKRLFEQQNASPHLLQAGFDYFNQADEFGILYKDISEMVKITEQFMSTKQK